MCKRWPIISAVRLFVQARVLFSADRRSTLRVFPWNRHTPHRGEWQAPWSGVSQRPRSLYGGSDSKRSVKWPSRQTDRRTSKEIDRRFSAAAYDAAPVFNPFNTGHNCVVIAGERISAFWGQMYGLIITESCAVWGPAGDDLVERTENGAMLTRGQAGQLSLTTTDVHAAHDKTFYRKSVLVSGS